MVLGFCNMAGENECYKVLVSYQNGMANDIIGEYLQEVVPSMNGRFGAFEGFAIEPSDSLTHLCVNFSSKKEMQKFLLMIREDKGLVGTSFD